MSNESPSMFFIVLKCLRRLLYVIFFWEGGNNREQSSKSLSDKSLENTSDKFGDDNITTAPEIDIVQTRNAKLSNMNNMILQIEVPGYLGVYAGCVVEVNIPDYSIIIAFVIR